MSKLVRTLFVVLPVCLIFVGGAASAAPEPVEPVEPVAETEAAAELQPTENVLPLFMEPVPVHHYEACEQECRDQYDICIEGCRNIGCWTACYDSFQDCSANCGWH